MNKQTLWKKGENIKVGDLVYHILYGRDWNALVLEIDEPNEKCKVHLVPGMRYENYFRTRGEKSLSGWMSIRWLAVCN